MSENLVLEYLRYIRGVVDRIGEDMQDIKIRMSSIEGWMAKMQRNEGDLASEISPKTSELTISIKGCRARLDAIESRLDPFNKRW